MQLRAIACAVSLVCLCVAPASAQTPAREVAPKEVAPKEVAPKAAAAKEAASKAKPPVVTASGLTYQALKEGSGAHPQATDRVKVHYRGTLPDGKEFDSSYKRNEPAEFPLNGVIKCWTEGVQLMKAGGKARLTCPPAIAYGERGAGGVIPPNATLIFEIELLEFKSR